LLPSLVACPHIARLATVELTDNDLTVDDLRALASSSFMARLKKLLLNSCQVEDAERVEALTGSCVFRLTGLGLGDNNLDETGAEVLASSPSLDRLEFLDLGADLIGPRGVRLLAESSNLRRLTSLDLYNNGVELEGAQALASSEHMAHLTHLDLTNG